MEYVRTLKAVHRADKDVVGERAVDLAVLQEKDFLVPLSFVITNEAFETFVNENKLQTRIGLALQGADRARVYDRVRELLLNADFPNGMVGEIVEAYESLGVELGDSLNDMVEAEDAPYVTVMLSPNHTLPSESKEGIILNVKGLEELLLAVKECWACLFTPGLQRYREEAGIGHRNLNVGVIVQHMPRGDVSAEAWSATGADTEQLTVKSYYGILDIGVGVEKDEFRLTREYLKPVYQSVGVQTQMLARDEEGKLGKAPLGPRGEEQKLNDKLMIELGRLAKKASQGLDAHAKLVFNVDGESISTLLCTRLLLTKGSVKLQGYDAEERIEEAPEKPAIARPEAADRAVTEREESTVAVDESTGEEEVLQHAEDTTLTAGLEDVENPTPVDARALEETVPGAGPERAEPIPDAEVEEPDVEDEAAEAPADQPVHGSTAAPAPSQAQEGGKGRGDGVQDDRPEEEAEVIEDEIREEMVEAVADVSDEAEGVEPLGEEQVDAVIEREDSLVAVDDETGESEVLGHEVERDVMTEQDVEADEELEAESVVVEADTPEAPAEAREEPEVGEGEPVEEETEAFEPVETEEAPDAPPVHSESEESTRSLAQEEDGEDEPAEEEPEESERETTISSYTLDEAFDLVKEALTQRYEKRFRNLPPSSMGTLFSELSSEIIVPHEELIGEFVQRREEGQELEDEFGARVLSIIDDFLDGIR